MLRCDDGLDDAADTRDEDRRLTVANQLLQLNQLLLAPNADRRRSLDDSGDRARREARDGGNATLHKPLSNVRKAELAMNRFERELGQNGSCRRRVSSDEKV